MTLDITVSTAATARRVIDALTRLGHLAIDDPALPGMVSVHLRDASDAPSVHRIAAMLDHPAAAVAA